METDNKNKHIIIIGAGVSGLSSASQLKMKGYTNITILEASNILGGRVRKYPKENNFCDIDIELGGEEVHGEDSEYYQIVLRNGGDLFSYWSDNEFYVNYKDEFNSVEEVAINKENSDLKFCWDLFEDLSYNFKKKYPDITLREYLRMKKISEDVYFLANGMLGVEAGTDLDQISVKGFQDLCMEWKSGPSNFLLTNMSHVDVIRKEFSDVVDLIKYNIPIVKIDYTDEKKIKLIDRDGNSYNCDICIITIPINQLKKLIFEPSLPDDINDAIMTIRMDSVAKIILKFKDSLWPKDASIILIPGLVNVYWPTGQGKNSKSPMLTGLVTAESCRVLNELYKKNKQSFIKKILEELMSGLKLQEIDFEEKLEDFIWFNWSDMEFIGGGYSFSGVNERDLRSSLRKNVNNRIFFAGEATAENGHFGTIHGAIESGSRVADQINKLN